ncbi:HNH endonuclease [Shewanella sp. Koi 1]
MFSVTYHDDSRRTKKYKTEIGALRAVWKWLRSEEIVGKGHYAIVIGPSITEPRVISQWSELPFSEQPNEVNFLQTTEWRQLRRKAFELYGNYCACCGKTPKNGAVLHVDHIKPRSLRPDLESDITNLQILCDGCNQDKSNISERKWR